VYLVSIKMHNDMTQKDIEDAARDYLLNEHRSPLTAVMHQADLKAEMVYHEDIEKAFKAGVEWIRKIS